MSESKYASVNVVDLEVSSDTGLSFKIKTAKSTEISRSMEDGLNYLMIKDALINDKLLEDIINGEYDRLDLSVKLRGEVRNVNDGADYIFTIKIGVARLESNRLNFFGGQPSDNVLVFSFSTVDAHGLANSEVKIGSIE